MATKILPRDSRIRHLSARINGQTYGYIRAEPTGTPHGTIFLLHGFPDLSFGWRYQIPLFTSLGLRVIAPDLMGYGLTSAPQSPAFYTYKRAADDMAELARQLGCTKIFLGGHDWEDLWCFALRCDTPVWCRPCSRLRRGFPHQARNMFLFFDPKYEVPTSIPRLRGRGQNSGRSKYQASAECHIWGKGLDGLVGFDMTQGFYFERLQGLQRTSIMSEDELDFYATQYVRNGIRGPINWYKTGELNFLDDKELGPMDKFKFEIPMLFIRGNRDFALPKSSSDTTGQYFTSLIQHEVDGGHWAHWEQPEEVNKYLKEFLVGKIDTSMIVHLRA